MQEENRVVFALCLSQLYCSLSYDKSVAFSKRVPQRVSSSVSFFNFQHPPIPLRLSSSCSHLLPRSPVMAILSSMFPSITCFRRQFLHKMWPIQLAALHFIGYRIFPSPDFFTSSALSSNIFQNFPGISDLLCKVSKFQHHTKAMLQM